MTNVVAKLLKAFEAKGVGYGQELIIFKPFCNEFIQASRLAGLAIIGIDGFYLLQDGSVKPNIDEIADFSDVEASSLDEYINKCTKATINFINKMSIIGKSDGYCFTLTHSLD